MYEYRVAEVVSVYDGDTVTLMVDVGFSTHIKLKVRLYGIDTPEIRGEERPEGLISRDWLRERLSQVDPSDITLKTYKDRTGKYGRYLGELFIKDEISSLNEQMVKLGLAEEYMK